MSHPIIADQSQKREVTALKPAAHFAPLWPSAFAECLGAFSLVFADCGAIMVNTVNGGQITYAGICLASGLIIAVLIYTFGHISGAHFNPAVTLAFVLVRHFPLRRLWVYWGAQFIGATLAALCLRFLLGNVAHLGMTFPSGNGGVWQSFAFEVGLTFFLMVVVMAMATDTRAIGQSAALAIGATITLESFLGGSISGASMNPARSLGPALASFTWTAQWVYLTAPFIGAVAGAFVYRWLREAGKLPPPHGGREGKHD